MTSQSPHHVNGLWHISPLQAHAPVHLSRMHLYTSVACTCTPQSHAPVHLSRLQLHVHHAVAVFEFAVHNITVIIW